MPRYSIRTTNSVFIGNDDEAVFDDPEDALMSGIQGAIEISADEIASGRPTSAVEVCVNDEDGRPLLRSVVALSVSPLLTDRRAVVTNFE